jgi:Flp pilus assembly protein TadB
MVLFVGWFGGWLVVFGLVWFVSLFLRCWPVSACCQPTNQPNTNANNANKQTNKQNKQANKQTKPTNQTTQKRSRDNEAKRTVGGDAKTWRLCLVICSMTSLFACFLSCLLICWMICLVGCAYWLNYLFVLLLLCLPFLFLCLLTFCLI